MNRDSRVFTAKQQTGSAKQVLLGPWNLDSIKDLKHKYSMVVYNRGNPNNQGYPVYIEVQYLAGSSWLVADQPAGLGSATVIVPSNSERTLEFYFTKGNKWRIVGYGVGGDTEGRVDVVEVEMESNISDR